MRIAAGLAFAMLLATPLVAQVTPQEKPVPKDSVRVSIPGCAKGYAFTVARRTAEEPGTVNVPAGVHLRLNGPGKTMSAIKAHKGSMIEITGIMKKTDLAESASASGGGVRFGAGPSPGGGVTTTPLGGQIPIDVENWRPIPGDCPR